MELPISVRCALEDAIAADGTSLADLRTAVERMTVSYKEHSGRGTRLVTEKTQVLAYAAARMPATFGAVSSALSYTRETLSEQTCDGIRTVLDLGAGTGTASAAAAECFPAVTEITAVEREQNMIVLGRQLTEAYPIRWISADACAYAAEAAKNGTKYDLVVTSYMTNEMDEQTRRTLLSALWKITGRLLVIIEPGTKVGSAILRTAKAQLVSEGASVCAPCPYSTDPSSCPIAEDDWCHFTCRVQRSRLHKQLKGGDVPFEDEKFSYLALTTESCTPAASRILRHPQKDPGHITLTLCRGDGITTENVTKRDKQRFTAARKAGAGDSFPG